MAVGFSNTNKPLNPRGQDASPKGYNRASLFSGKALDFDGANDSIDISNFSLNGYTAFSICFHKKGDFNNGMIFSSADSISDGVNIYQISPGYFRARLNGVNAVDTTLKVSDIDGFFVFTYDGTNAKWYYQAENIDSETTSQTFSIANTTSTIGRQSFASVQYLNGKIAGFKIFNTALTAAQVADLYNNPEKVVPTGVDNTALKLWLPMMEGAGTTAYNGAPDALGSELVTNGTFDTDSDWFKGTGWTISGGKANRSGASGNSPVYQNVPVVNGKRYVFSYTRTYVSGYGETNVFVKLDNVNYSTIGRYVSTITEEHKVIGEFTAGFTGNLLWQIYGITDFTGSIDNVEIKEMTGYGTISGATWTHGIGAPVAQTSVIDWNKHTLDGTNEVLIPQGLTSGRDLLGNLFENVRKQGALNLDGNSWAEVHDNESLDITPAMTMECWVDFSEIDSTAYRHFIVKPSGATWASPYARYALRGSNASVQWWFESAGFVEVYSVSLTGWNHIAVTKDGTAEILYINGAQVDTATNNATITASAENLLLGQATTGTEPLDSQIAQPRIYNRALTASEVLQNYNSGKNTYTND